MTRVDASSVIKRSRKRERENKRKWGKQKKRHTEIDLGRFRKNIV